MFQLLIIKRFKDGEGNFGGATPFDVIVQNGNNPNSQQFYLCSAASLAAAKTAAQAYFTATLSWTDGTEASNSATFTHS